MHLVSISMTEVWLCMHATSLTSTLHSFMYDHLTVSFLDLDCDVWTMSWSPRVLPP